MLSSLAYRLYTRTQGHLHCIKYERNRATLAQYVLLTRLQNQNRGCHLTRQCPPLPNHHRHQLHT